MIYLDDGRQVFSFQEFLNSSLFSCILTASHSQNKLNVDFLRIFARSRGKWHIPWISLKIYSKWNIKHEAACKRLKALSRKKQSSIDTFIAILKTCVRNDNLMANNFDLINGTLCKKPDKRDVKCSSLNVDSFSLRLWMFLCVLM